MSKNDHKCTNNAAIIIKFTSDYKALTYSPKRGNWQGEQHPEIQIHFKNTLNNRNDNNNSGIE